MNNSFLSKKSRHKYRKHEMGKGLFLCGTKTYETSMGGQKWFDYILFGINEAGGLGLPLPNFTHHLVTLPRSFSPLISEKTRQAVTHALGLYFLEGTSGFVASTSVPHSGWVPTGPSRSNLALQELTIVKYWSQLYCPLSNSALQVMEILSTWNSSVDKGIRPVHFCTVLNQTLLYIFSHTLALWSQWRTQLILIEVNNCCGWNDSTWV